MRHPCPEKWAYEQHPKRAKLVGRHVEDILNRLRRGQINPHAAALDTRPIHAELFSGLTPPHFPFYAGHYRGEQYPCLEHLRVGVQGDPRVGAMPAVVATEMSALSTLLDAGFSAAESPAARSLPAHAQLLNLVRFAAQAFEVFLRIHPYVNGNGHIGRFLIWAILGRFGHWPRRFPIEPRPSAPGYGEAIIEHRNGNPAPLAAYILQHLQ